MKQEEWLEEVAEQIQNTCPCEINVRMAVHYGYYDGYGKFHLLTFLKIHWIIKRYFRGILASKGWIQNFWKGNFNAIFFFIVVDRMGFIFFPEDLTLEEYKNKSSFIGPMLACYKNGRWIFLWQAKIETLNWIFLRCQHDHMYVLADFKRTQGVLTEKQKTSMWSCWHLEIFHSEKGIKLLHVWFQAMINSQANMIT